MKKAKTHSHTLVSRNGINLHTKAISTIVYSNDAADIIKQKLIATLSKAGVQ